MCLYVYVCECVRAARMHELNATKQDRDEREYEDDEEETYTHEHRIVHTVGVLTCKMDDQTYICTPRQTFEKKNYEINELAHNLFVHIETLVV